jgi:hypothetical protein
MRVLPESPPTRKLPQNGCNVRVGDQPDTIARWEQRLLGKVPTPYPRGW